MRRVLRWSIGFICVGCSPEASGRGGLVIADAQETSSVLMRELPIELVRAPLQWPPYHPSALESAQAPPNAQITVPAADVAVGACACAWGVHSWDALGLLGRL